LYISGLLTLVFSGEATSKTKFAAVGKSKADIADGLQPVEKTRRRRWR